LIVVYSSNSRCSNFWLDCVNYWQSQFLWLMYRQLKS
jgi:hypothetical protein